jgi:hypothetical protein
MNVLKYSLSAFIYVLVLLYLPSVYAEEYSFDLSEIEKKPYDIGGYIEFRPNLFLLDEDAALYKLKFFDQDARDTLDENNFKLQLDLSLEKGISRVFIRTNTDYQKSSLVEKQKTTIYEGYLSLKPSSSLTINAGKKVLKWGKGYAWTPVAFIDRQKDPNDPALALEGFIVASADFIKSFQGPLKTLAVTPVLVPVYENINDDFGEIDNMNFAGKVYLLLYDTDIDFIILTGGSRTTRYGFDFSRNILSNFEIHGEFAFINNFKRKVIDSNGNVFEEKYDSKSYLFGIRYLTERDMTIIAEYYHNGTGFTHDEMKNFFSFIDNAYDSFISSGDNSLLRRVSNLTKGSYGKINPMRNYLYMRVSRKEPYDILYFTPSITGILNLDDKSFSLSPELVYTGITNMELRLKPVFLVGQNDSEYGEKANDLKVELRARYFF